MDGVTVNGLIKLLDKPGNKTGGATGRERILSLTVNGQYLGYIQSAKLDGWGDGLITDVNLAVIAKENPVENAELTVQYDESGNMWCICSKCRFDENTINANYCSNCGAMFVKKE